MSNVISCIVVVVVAKLSFIKRKVLLPPLLLVAGLLGDGDSWDFVILGDGVRNHCGAVQVDHMVSARHLRLGKALSFLLLTFSGALGGVISVTEKNSKK